MFTKTKWFGLALLAACVHTQVSAAECDLRDVNSARKLHELLSLRAVELIRRAQSSDDTLDALVSPAASFSLGAGDVGRPLGTGLAGARALAGLMHADAYRFLGWDDMDMSVKPCVEQKVEIEFTDHQGRRVSRVEFTFNSGRVVDASGWERSFTAGAL